MIEQVYFDLLLDLSTDESSHSKGRSLLDHLKGTHELLEKWVTERTYVLEACSIAFTGRNTTKFNLRIWPIENISPAS